MIQLTSYLKIVDNTGVNLVQCIKVLGTSNKKIARIGDIIIVSIKKIFPYYFSYQKKIKFYLKGSVQRALIVSSKSTLNRAKGIYLKIYCNGAVLVDNKGVPGSNRIKNPIPMEVCKKFNSVGSISNLII